MDRKNLISVLRTQYGYTGEDSLEAVKKFASEANIEFAGKSLEDIFQPAKKSVILTDPTDEDDADEDHDDAVDARQKGVEDARRAVAALKGGRDGQTIKVRDRIEDDKNVGYKSFGHYLSDVKTACGPGSVAPERLQKAMGALGLKAPTNFGNETVGAEGGFAVPPAFIAQIMEMTAGEESLVARTNQIPLSTNNVTIPADENTDWDTAQGIQANIIAEGAEITTSKPSLREINARLYKINVLVPVTEELEADSSALSAYVPRKAGRKLDFRVGGEIMRGPGGSRAVGLLNANCKIAVAKESGQAADTINYNNIVKMWKRLYGPYRANSVWLMNQDAEDQLMLMSMPVGTGGLPVYLPPAGASASPYATLFGRPVITTQHCETLGDEGDIVLWAPQEYYTFTRGGIQSAQSMHVYFSSEHNAYRFTYRFNGQPGLSAAINPRDGSSTMSSIVTLVDRT